MEGLIFLDIDKTVDNITNASSYNLTKKEPKTDMELMITLKSVCMALEIMNIILHSLGSYLLLTAYRRGRKTAQLVYIINLSLTELLKNVAHLFSGIAYVLKPASHSSLIAASWYMCYILYTSIYYLNFSAMFFLTGDRLLATLLNCRYNVIWTLRKTKIVLTFTWCFCCFVVFPAVSAVYFIYGWEGLKHEGLQMILIYNIPAGFNVAFLLFAIASYTIMFVRFINSHRKSRTSQQSVFHLFRHSKFYVSILLITSFLILMVTPNLVLSILWITETDFQFSVKLYAGILMLLSDTVDALIYVFMYKPIRTILVTKVNSMLNCFRPRNGRTPNMQAPTVVTNLNTYTLPSRYEEHQETHVVSGLSRIPYGNETGVKS